MNAPAPAPWSRRAVEAIRRVVALVPVVLRTVRRIAIVSAAAVTGVAAASLALEPPGDATEWLTRAAITLAALVPAAVLLLFAAGIADLRELPSRYRDLPADVRTGLTDARGGRAEPRRGRLRSLVALARTVIEARDVLSPFALVSAALRPALLVAALLSAAIALVEVPVALVILLLLVA